MEANSFLAFFGVYGGRRSPRSDTYPRASPGACGPLQWLVDGPVRRPAASGFRRARTLRTVPAECNGRSQPRWTVLACTGRHNAKQGSQLGDLTYVSAQGAERVFGEDANDTVKILEYTSQHVPAVQRFNERLAAGGSPWRFPECPIAPWLPRSEEASAWQELYVVVDGCEVRGGYMLKSQWFRIRGEDAVAAGFQLPVSEGIIDRRYALVGARMLRHALARQPLLYGLGMGSRSAAVARLFKTMHFEFLECPFFFYVARPVPFLREIAYLRADARRSRQLDLLADSGLGWIGLKSVQTLRRHRARQPRGVRAVVVTRFGEAVDTVWREGGGSYLLVARRTAEDINAMFPPGDDRFIRLEVRHDDAPVGWAVVSDTQMTNDRYFGAMRVGAVIDGFAQPGWEGAVVSMAQRMLLRRGVDVIVTNQMGERWRSAFLAAGYLHGPTNFHFAASRELASRLEPLERHAGRLHLTRGDGDGPVGLVPGFAQVELPPILAQDHAP